MAAALLAPALLLASGAQGLRYFRCATGEVSLHSCCPPRVEQRSQGTTLAGPQAGCCEAHVVPAPEPLEPQVAAPASPPALVAVAEAIAARCPQRTTAREDPREGSPPEGTAIHLLLCALLI